MDFIKNNKFLVFAATLTLGLFLWAELSSFKLFRSEHGNEYAPNTNHGSVHHK